MNVNKLCLHQDKKAKGFQIVHFDRSFSSEIIAVMGLTREKEKEREEKKKKKETDTKTVLSDINPCPYVAVGQR